MTSIDRGCSLDIEHIAVRRPRLLFLARGFPPARASSCTRTWNIAKYLTRLGWDVTVVTPDASIWRQIDNPDEVERKIAKEGIKTILTDHGWRWLGHNHFKTQSNRLTWFTGAICRLIAKRLGWDDGIGWIRPAEQACSILTRGDVDLILATGPPPSAFRLAYRLSKRLGCPYIMDYRDPWTQSPHRARAVPHRRIQEEARLLDQSAAVTIVSHSWAEAMRRQHALNEDLHVISNGYDPEDLAKVAPIKYDHFAIVYTGVFYPPKRVITPIMQALNYLKTSDSSSGYLFHYYGHHQNHVREEARRYDVSDRTVLHGLVSQNDALSALRGAGVAIVITSVSEQASLEDQGIVTGKIFESIGLNVPIILIAPPGSDAEVVLRATGLGKAFRATDIAGIAGFLRVLMSGYKPREGHPNHYAWPTLASRLSCILTRVLERTSPSPEPRISNPVQLSR